MRLIIFILIVFPCLAFSQEDSVTVAASQIINAAETIKDQANSIMDLRNINAELIHQNNQQSIIIKRQEQEIDILVRQNQIADGIISDYKSHLKKDKRFFKSRIFYFVSGIATAYVSSIIVKNIVD